SSCMPIPNAAAVQPRLACTGYPDRQKWIASAWRLPAFEASVRRRVDRVAKKPFGDAELEGPSLSFCTRENIIDLGDAGPLLEVCLPVGHAPWPGGIEESSNGAFVPAQQFEHVGGRRL